MKYLLILLLLGCTQVQPKKEYVNYKDADLNKDDIVHVQQFYVIKKISDKKYYRIPHCRLYFKNGSHFVVREPCWKALKG